MEDRKRDRETERQRDRETERQRDRETERQRDRETDRQTERDRKKTERQTERDRKRQRGSDRETENIKWHGGIRNTNARDNKMEQTILREVSRLRYVLFVTRTNFYYRFPISI
jgi:hypothetical protein